MSERPEQVTFAVAYDTHEWRELRITHNGPGFVNNECLRCGMRVGNMSIKNYRCEDIIALSVMEV